MKIPSLQYVSDHLKDKDGNDLPTFQLDIPNRSIVDMGEFTMADTIQCQKGIGSGRVHSVFKATMILCSDIIIIVRKTENSSKEEQFCLLEDPLQLDLCTIVKYFYDDDHEFQVREEYSDERNYSQPVRRSYCFRSNSSKSREAWVKKIHEQICVATGIDTPDLPKTSSQSELVNFRRRHSLKNANFGDDDPHGSVFQTPVRKSSIKSRQNSIHRSRSRSNNERSSIKRHTSSSSRSSLSPHSPKQPNVERLSSSPSILTLSQQQQQQHASEDLNPSTKIPRPRERARSMLSSPQRRYGYDDDEDHVLLVEEATKHSKKKPILKKFVDKLKWTRSRHHESQEQATQSSANTSMISVGKSKQLIDEWENGRMQKSRGSSFRKDSVPFADISPQKEYFEGQARLSSQFPSPTRTTGKNHFSFDIPNTSDTVNVLVNQLGSDENNLSRKKTTLSEGGNAMSWDFEGDFHNNNTSNLENEVLVGLDFSPKYKPRELHATYSDSSHVKQEEEVEINSNTINVQPKKESIFQRMKKSLLMKQKKEKNDELGTAEDVLAEKENEAVLRRLRLDQTLVFPDTSRILEDLKEDENDDEDIDINKILDDLNASSYKESRFQRRLSKYNPNITNPELEKLNFQNQKLEDEMAREEQEFLQRRQQLENDLQRKREEVQIGHHSRLSNSWKMSSYQSSSVGVVTRGTQPLGQFIIDNWQKLMLPSGSGVDLLAKHGASTKHGASPLLSYLRERQSDQGWKSNNEESKRQNWTGDIGVDVYGSKVKEVAKKEVKHGHKHKYFEDDYDNNDYADGYDDDDEEEEGEEDSANVSEAVLSNEMLGVIKQHLQTADVTHSDLNDSNSSSHDVSAMVETSTLQERKELKAFATQINLSPKTIIVQNGIAHANKRANPRSNFRINLQQQQMEYDSIERQYAEVHSKYFPKQQVPTTIMWALDKQSPLQDLNAAQLRLMAVFVGCLGAQSEPTTV